MPATRATEEEEEGKGGPGRTSETAGQCGRGADRRESPGALQQGHGSQRPQKSALASTIKLPSTRAQEIGRASCRERVSSPV